MPIDVASVSKRYGEVVALSNVSLTIREGRIYGILGPNGAGKTTLLKIIAGVLVPDRGSVLVDGYPSLSVEARRLVGYVPELPSMPSWMTGCDYLASMWLLEGVGVTEARRHAASVLDELGVRDLCSKRASEMSKGQKKIVMLAESLYGPRTGEKKYYLLDEPFAGLSPDRTNLVMRRIVEVWRGGASIVLATHRTDIVAGLITDVIIIKQGQVLLTVDVDEYLSREKLRYKLRLVLSPRLGVKHVDDIVGFIREMVSRHAEQGVVRQARGGEIVVFTDSLASVFEVMKSLSPLVGREIRSMHVEMFSVEDLYVRFIGDSIGDSEYS